jgi:hypothetical protein
MPVNAPEALAPRMPIPLVPNRMRRFSNPRFSRFRPELEQGHSSPRAFGLVLQARCAKALCFSRYWMIIELKMGTRARLIQPKSVKRDQPTYRALRTREAGWYWGVNQGDLLL